MLNKIGILSKRIYILAGATATGIITSCVQPSVMTSSLTDPSALVSSRPSASPSATSAADATKICTGTTINNASGTATCLGASAGSNSTDADVLAGTYYWNSSGVSTLGTMVDRGTNWDLTTAFPGAGKYSGVTTGISLSKVCSNQNVLGSPGTAVCQIGTTSSAATAGDIIAGNEAWDSAGSKITGTLTNRGTLDVSTAYPGSGYYGASPSNAPTATQICTNTTVFGVPGSATCGAVYGDLTASRQHRDRATTQVTLKTEATTSTASLYTNANPGYRAIPVISKDDEGINGSVTNVARTSWDTACDATGATGAGGLVCKCGTSGTIAARIADCAAHGTIGSNATWEGGTKGNSGQGDWKLVTRTGAVSSSKGREVWQDQRTKLLWSSSVAKWLNWCKASGSNNITNNPAKENDSGNYCNNASYQVTGATGAAVSACFEDDGTNFTQTDGAIDTAGKGGLGRTSVPVVGWRLPTKYDFLEAEINGIRFVMPDMGLSYGGQEWSTTLYSLANSYGFAFSSVLGTIEIKTRNQDFAVRCVGR